MEFKNMSLEKLMCPICRGILIEPVTMPCSHVLCLECFEGTMEMANLTCPLCRKRVGGWLRTVKKKGKLVNHSLWAYIQANYASYIEAKKLGEDDAFEDELEGTAPPPVQISLPGEIRKEFENSQATLDRELQQKQEIEQKASEELIRKLQEEEHARAEEAERQRLEREQEDERIARELQSELEQEEAERLQNEAGVSVEIVPETLPNRSATGPLENIENKLMTSPANTIRGPLDIFLRPVKDNTPKRENKQQGLENRCNSISPEILHFKPITSVPLTPPKTSPDGKVVEVQLIRATPVKNILRIDNQPSGCSSTLARQLSTLQVERKASSSVERPSSTSVAASTSAFINFHWNVNNPAKKFCPSSTVTSSSMSQENNALLNISNPPRSPDMFASDEDSKLDEEEMQCDNQEAGQFFTEQERLDFLLARQLQNEFDLERKVDRSEGSHLAYKLRKRSLSLKGVTKKKTSLQRNRTQSSSQPTLKEAFRRAANKYSQ